MGGGEETEKERMCERQPDEPLLERGGGLGSLGCWVMLPRSHPTGWSVLCWDRMPLARMMPWVGGCSRGWLGLQNGARGTGPQWGCWGPLPLRAFFCSFSVSDDFFLISCLARLYSAAGARGELK